MRLSQATFGALDTNVVHPAYDRLKQKCGIVHFGIGAFHRAHQAVYTDDAMAAGDHNWGIIGVSLRSADVREQMEPQDGLYSVIECSAKSSAIRLIGAVQTVIVAPENPQAVIDALASPDTHIVTFTITEKGYRRRPDGGLDTDADDVAHDLNGADSPRTIYGFLAKALAKRCAQHLGGLTLVSCDNLSQNGKYLRSLLESYLERVEPVLADWFREHCACPSTMVDRIVPATTDADKNAFAAEIGCRDEAVVLTEPFRQWVIEDNFVGSRPRWESGGAQFVADVGPYEVAKLRMLNGAHSALAYLGLLRGHEFVHQAIADNAIRPTIERLMRVEAAATLTAVPGLNASAYADALLARFANSALPHRLAQIAMDGSQKIPQRWLEPLALNRAAGRECPATLQALAAWILHIRGDLRSVDDPMASQLASLWRSAGENEIVAALFGEDGLFGVHWTASADDRAKLTSAFLALADGNRFDQFGG